MILTLVEAIAHMEGFGRQFTRATRNHNPGNINYGEFAQAHGATGPDDKGYAVFADNLTGFAALNALLKTPRYRGMTLERAIETYCPARGDPRGNNDTQAYIRNVTEWTGIQPDEVIDDHVI